MGQHYSQISFAERRRIQDLRDVKVPVSAIAEELGRHRSTIHREIRRNFYHDPFRDRWGKEYKGYYCTSAQKYAQDRRARRRLKLTLNPRLRDHVIAKLGEGWSPQQIAGRLKHDALPLGTVSHVPVIGRIAQALAPFPCPARKTITFDRGTEFFAYKALTMDSYFCDPHSPWQKGGVENANGRVRRHLPLASSETERTPAALTALARRLNDTPRRCLGYRTPAEVFAANLASLATSAQVGIPEHPLPRPLVPLGPQA